MEVGAIRPGSQAEQVGRLILAGVLVIVLPQLPLGNYILYPFTILTTWFHEMGHGLTALLLGYDFERLVILPNGSGYAVSYGDNAAWSRALVAAGGPIAPSLAGALLIVASAREKRWRPTLLVLAAIIALSVAIWVRSVVGWIVLPLVAAALVWIGLRGADWLARFSLQFLGVLGALSMLRDWDYLFSESAVIGGQVMPSDTGAIERALWLPHWIWAVLILGFSGTAIVLALKHALAEEGAVRPRGALRFD